LGFPTRWPSGQLVARDFLKAGNYHANGNFWSKPGGCRAPQGNHNRGDEMKRNSVCKQCGKVTVSKIHPRVRIRKGRVKDPAYLSWCSKQPCCVSGELPATTHHVRSWGSPKDDTRVIRLAKRFHIEAEIKKLRDGYLATAQGA
jgi:hypothetical protein